MDAEFLSFNEDIGLAAELRNEDVLSISDATWDDVFVATGEFLDSIDMHSAFVGEGGATYEGGTGEVRIVRNIIHEVREISKLLELRDDLHAQFEL
jgi:hypothetical protein